MYIGIINKEKFKVNIPIIFYDIETNKKIATYSDRVGAKFFK